MKKHARNMEPFAKKRPGWLDEWDAESLEPEFGKIWDRQQGRCAGCSEPLTEGTAETKQDHDSWTFRRTRTYEEEDVKSRTGRLQYKKARSLGGSRGNAEDLEFMCDECIGTTTRSVRLPRYLMGKSEEWLKSHHENPKDYVRSFNHLVRLAIERYISTEDELLKEALELEKAKSLKKDLKKEISAMLSAVDEMRSGLSEAKSAKGIDYLMPGEEDDS